jgi:hypothetical protein
MAPGSAAERQRRYKRHKRGDHSLCDPARRCELMEQAEANEAVATAHGRPGGRYGPRGQALHDAVAAEPWVGPLQVPLLDEACRLVDRLDRLDAALEVRGTWLRHDRGGDGDLVIVIDSVLSETRQQEMTLRSLLAELDKVAERAAKSAKQGGLQPSRKGGGLSDLSARIAARRGTSAG